MVPANVSSRLVVIADDDPSTGTGFLTERERWLRALPVEAREELLFEFEMLLRSVERYVHLHDNGVIDPQDKPLVTRDLLPLGSPAAMDLVFAFDDRIQAVVYAYEHGIVRPSS